MGSLAGSTPSMTTGGEPTATGDLKTSFAYPRVMGAEATTVRTTSARRVSPAREEKYRAERNQIVRAAYELTERDGSKETSVHDILDAAGLSTRAFYRHFRSKDELVLEMYRVDCHRVNATVAAAVASAPDPLAALEAWIDQNLAVVYDARRLRHAVVLSSAEVSSADGFTEVKNTGLAEQRAPLVALLHEGHRGVFPHTDPETDALAIQAVVGARHAGPARSRSRRTDARRSAPPHARPVPARAGDAGVIVSGRAPSTPSGLTRHSYVGRSTVAGPCTRLPSVTRNTLPCHGQVMHPSRTSPSSMGAPRWGHRASRATMSPASRSTMTGASPASTRRGVAVTWSASATRVHSFGGRDTAVWSTPTPRRCMRWPPR